MEAKAAGQADPNGLDDTGRELESLRSAARWIVGASASVLAVVVAGVQFSAIGEVDDLAPTGFGVALLAALTALTCTGAVLWLAARVLVPPRWTMTELAHVELTEPEKWAGHWANAELRGRRALLAPLSELRLSHLYRHHRALFVASVELVERGRAVVEKDLLGTTGARVTYHAGAQEDVDRLHQRLHLAEQLSERVVDTVNLADVHRRYRRLIGLLPWLGGAALVGVATFVLVTAPPGGTPVTGPVEVQVRFTEDPDALADADLPPGCRGLTVTGVAVGGTLEEPVVTSIERAECVLRQVELPKGTAAVIPSVPKS
ncbi:hypothetical protein [Saccharothrix xinjiangensis]|uniref:Uncharacterized protein n=1 Tax=Saccharothrix xinjiangensis TaxID=204798 RepID=A0ABV9XYY6_9PSEU